MQSLLKRRISWVRELMEKTVALWRHEGQLNTPEQQHGDKRHTSA
jgi:hypothetical protein